MNNSIFYSWQSDLPNRTNRTFIEDCLKDAVGRLTEIGSVSIEYAIDRDTKKLTGTPDIVQSIFDKIETTKVFVADVSIINSEESGRKTPNPNVLIELGYAAKVLGWDRIICLYNLDYGTYDDIPFDLRQRRPLTYQLNNKERSKVKKEISKIITENIFELYKSGVLLDTVSDYLKMQVDTEILTIINHLIKIFFGYNKPKTLETFTEFLGMSDEELNVILKDSQFLGFQIFKKWHVNESNLKNIADTSMASSFHGREVAAVIIELMRWVGGFENFNRTRTNPDIYKLLGTSNGEVRSVNGLSFNPRNSEFPDRFILLRKVDSGERVEDFGDFIEQGKIENLTNTFKMTSAYITPYVEQIREFIRISKKWLDITNGEFIIENNKMFEIFNDTKY